MKTKKILDWCNSIRKKLRLKPIDRLIPGYRYDEEACVLANTIKHDSKKTILVDGQYVLHNNLIIAEIAEFIQEFVIEFDHGKAPKKYYA